eukprot:TRINITY_DN7719_c0_g1_i1.p1 TRINITY_DN7719_c0_g1~~TRINITY_DN7719_c0_g1_i1.p1  ORF type:complete len:666 (+),score=182.92 TRINITY_DN7719_c0_g1_i1:93-2090(+)
MPATGGRRAASADPSKAEAREKARRKQVEDAEIWKYEHPIQVDELAQALLREFMHRKNFLQTLAAFDRESPRSSRTIASRLLMGDMMHIQDTQRRMKEEGRDAETIMGMLCMLRMERRDRANAREGDDDSSNSDELEVLRRSGAQKGARLRRRKLLAELQRRKELLAQQRAPEPASGGGKKDKEKKKAKESRKKGKREPGVKDLSWDQLLRVKDGDEEEEEHIQPATTPSPAKPDGRHSAADRDTESSQGSPQKPLARPAPAPDKPPPPRSGWGDPDPMGGSGFGGSLFGIGPAVRGLAIGDAQAQRLKHFLIGKLERWPESWVSQGFRFSADNSRKGQREVSYGLVQNNGGPCGVLAAVQARVIQRLFHSGSYPDVGTGADLPHGVQAAVLVDALADVLYEVAAGGSVSVALPPDADTYSSGPSPAKRRCSLDLSDWRVQSVGRDRDGVRALLEQYQPFLLNGFSSGLLALVISAIYTRGGVESVSADMDDAGLTLIAAHQYTSQELVSLLLYGRAHSNVFDGLKVFEGGSDRVQLRGVPHQSPVGLLSITEHYGDQHVGSHLKCPKWPVWLIYNESHYSVLFAKQRLDDAAESVDVYYYDQHGMQEDEFRLTLDLASGRTMAESALRPKGEMTPYVEDIIRTREEWARALVSWNDADPLSIPV